MKKYFLGIILLLSFFLVGCGKKDDFEKDIKFQGKFFEDYIAGEYQVVDNYDDYIKIFTNVEDEVSNKLSKEDFDKNNYLVFKMAYDYCVKNDVEVSGYSLDDGIVTVDTKYLAVCRNCIEMDNYDYYVLKLPKSFKVKDIKVNEKVLESDSCKDSDLR